jgi:hypothetical protein
MNPAFEELRKCIYTTECEIKRLQQLLVNAVMATDIFDPDMKKLRDSRWQKAFSTSAYEENNKSDASVDKMDLKAAVVIERIIQAADVAVSSNRPDDKAQE